MPQVRNTAEHFVSRVIPDTRAVVRTRPLEALIIGGYVRGLSDRDIESLAEEAELGYVSKSTVSRICRELRDRYTAFCNKSLADVSVMALFMDATYLPTRPSGQKEGVLVVWGYTTAGKRVLLAVRLGQRESHEDWLDLGRDLTRRGLPAPWLVPAQPFAVRGPDVVLIQHLAQARARESHDHGKWIRGKSQRGQNQELRATAT
jgi:hypothetical protein